jgi:phage N-6-adenine-methyltransferase
MANRLRDCWATPWEFFEALDRVFCFGIDVCASMGNAKCERFYALERGEDGLALPWAADGPAWCNAGFSGLVPWFDKAIAEAERGVVAVCLSHAATGTHWWNDRAGFASEVWLLYPRIQFVPPEGVEASHNARDSVLTVFTPWSVERYGDAPAVRLVDWRGIPRRKVVHRVQLPLAGCE